MLDISPYCTHKCTLCSCQELYGATFGSDLFNKSSLDELFPKFFLYSTKQTYLYVYLCTVEHISTGQIPRRVISRSGVAKSSS